MLLDLDPFRLAFVLPAAVVVMLALVLMLLMLLWLLVLLVLLLPRARGVQLRGFSKWRQLWCACMLKFGLPFVARRRGVPRRMIQCARRLWGQTVPLLGRARQRLRTRQLGADSPSARAWSLAAVALARGRGLRLPTPLLLPHRLRRAP